MSADFRTEHFKGYEHKGSVHVVVVPPPDDRWGTEWALGDFSLAEITELAEMAGQAWPSSPGVQVRFEIEVRLPGAKVIKDWSVVWSAPATEADEDFAEATYAGMRGAPPAEGMQALQWRLVRRTTVTHEEILQPEGPGEGDDDAA